MPDRNRNFLSTMYGGDSEDARTPGGDADRPIPPAGDATRDVVRIRVGTISYEVPSLGYVARVEQQIRAPAEPASDATDVTARKHNAALQRDLNEALRRLRSVEASISHLKAVCQHQASKISSLSAELATKAYRSH